MLTEKRIVYTNREYDITIIEIKKDKDNINDFLELENFGEDIQNYLQKLSVYLLYSRREKCLVSFGIIKNIIKEEGKIIHTCASEPGSAGGPIISLISGKVIGMHNGVKMNKKIKIGTLLFTAILDFLKTKK